MTPDLRDTISLTLTHAATAFRLACDIFHDAARAFAVADAALNAALASDDPDDDFPAAAPDAFTAARDKRDATEAALKAAQEVYYQLNGIHADLLFLLAARPAP